MASEVGKYSTCEIADALTALGADYHFHVPHLKPFGESSSTLVGRAYTVVYAPLSDPRPPVKGHYIDSVPKDSIVVISTDNQYLVPYAPYTRLSCALYGGLMASRAKYLGSKGTVVLGNVRDVEEQKSHPLFGFGLSSTAASLNAKVVSVGETIEFGGLLFDDVYGSKGTIIQSDDYLAVDAHGAVIIREQLLQPLLDSIPKRVEADRLAQKDILEGKPAADSIKYHRGKLGK
ncbi:4-hydroxy-4-methyl-2-oxoglutarate aldolase [Trichomonascus vanleenenianus]|uniref:bifunctional 4-hydroxy-4-methyl-2-oxoglutarate aldolase/oxaloacetate decarboxylase n=1 Tax=Trichomonascus vanleenenianus TaxID=2268995 RepID=UPI003ECBA73E